MEMSQQIGTMAKYIRNVAMQVVPICGGNNFNTKAYHFALYCCSSPSTKELLPVDGDDQQYWAKW